MKFVPEKERQLLDAEQASRFLGLPMSWLATKRRNGEQPCFYKFGQGRSQRIYYDFDDLKAFLESCRKNTRSEKKINTPIIQA